MSQTPRKRASQFSDIAPKRGIDAVAPSKDASQFPAIGMTLSSYQNRRNSSQKKSTTLNEPLRQSRRSRFASKFSLKRSVLVLLLVLVLIGVFLGGKIVYDLQKAFGGNIFDLFHSTKLKGENSGRVNILLAGEAGQNSGQTGGPDLTDSIMVVSLDTKNNTGWMLSIPRDLYVNIPNEGYGKINATYEDGNKDNFNAPGYPHGGMGELEQMVARKLGIPIDYYALINYDAFKQAVDAVGGIKVDIQSQDPRGLFDAYTHLKLSNGWVTLNGQQALNLARARGDDVSGDVSYGFPQSDFDRTMHQRQMLGALKAKVSSTGVLSNPIDLSNLFDALGNNVKTDLNLSDARRLYTLSKLIPNNKIQSLSLNSADGQNLLANYFDAYGQEDLIPAAGVNNYQDIQSFVAQHSTNNPIVLENAKVVVLNGTNISGLASKYQQKLRSDHVNVDQIGDANNISLTQIIDNSSGNKPATRSTLVQMFGNNVTTINPYSGIYTADFIVVLGANSGN